MKPYRRCTRVLLLSTAVLISANPGYAQVEKVAMRTAGISCGTCAAVSEINLRRFVSGIDKIIISKSQEAVLISYKPGAPFRLQAIRDVLEPLDVVIVQIQIGARGRLQEQSGKQFFVAGKDRFALIADSKAPKVPPGSTVSIEAVLNDRTTPMELKVLSVKPIAQ